MIEIKELTIRYGNTVVLQNVNLSLQKSCVVLGNNGSGKSSFAKALTALVEYEGEVFLSGKKLADYTQKELAKQVVYVPAKLESFETNMTLFEFVLFGRYAHKSAFGSFGQKDRDVVQKQLQHLGIWELRDRPVASLSSGQSALALIAMALVSEAGVLLFDEPTANLDPKNTRRIALLLKELSQRYTVLLITHDIALAAFMKQDVVFVKERSIRFFQHENFFNDAALSEHYGVPFKNLGVLYEN